MDQTRREAKRRRLFGLTPGEHWVWDYLEYLAEVQGSTCIILPRPGEDPDLEKVYSRRHLKRLLRGIKVKFPIQLMIPRSKSKQIEVSIPASILRTPMSAIGPEDDTHVRNNGDWVTPMSAIETLRTPMSAIKEIISNSWPEIAASQAKLKSYIKKRLLKAKQGSLRGEILELSEREVKLLRQRLRQIMGMEPKGRSVSERAKAYAMLRFLQGAAEIDKPQVWMDNVARRAAKEFEGRR